MRFHPGLNKQRPITLRSVLRKQREFQRFFTRRRVDLVFVHGSLARGEMKPLSDVDIAILFRDNHYTQKNVSQIFEKMCECIGREDIDLAILNNASPLLGMQVLKHGKALYVRNEKVLKGFRYKAIQRYLQTKHLRRSFHKAMERAILERAA